MKSLKKTLIAFLLSGTLSTAQAAAFNNITSSAGLANIPCSMVEAVDVNKDGLVDIVTNGQNGIVLLINKGDGTFKKTYPIKHPASSAVFSDCDSDGDLDVLILNPNGDNKIYLNDGTGKFSPAATPQELSGKNITAAAWSSLKDDSSDDDIPDILAGGEGDEYTRESGQCGKDIILINNGKCRFTLKTFPDDPRVSGCTNAITAVNKERILSLRYSRVPSEEETERFHLDIQYLWQDSSWNPAEEGFQGKYNAYGSDDYDPSQEEDNYGGSGHGMDCITYRGRIYCCKGNEWRTRDQLEWDHRDPSGILYQKDPSSGDTGFEWYELPEVEQDDADGAYLDCTFLDYNLDGTPDVIYTNKGLVSTPVGNKNPEDYRGRLYRGNLDENGIIRFTLVNGELETFAGESVVALDFDGDGDPDIAQCAETTYSDHPSPHLILFENNGSGSNHYLKVRPIRINDNATESGIEVILTDPDNPNEEIEKCVLGSRFGIKGKQSPFECIFGLGADPAETYTVKIKTSDSQKEYNISPDTVFRPVFDGELTIYRGEFGTGQCKSEQDPLSPSMPELTATDQWPYVDKNAADVSAPNYCYGAVLNGRWIPVHTIKRGSDIVLKSGGSSVQYYLLRDSSPESLRDPKHKTFKNFRGSCSVDDSGDEGNFFYLVQNNTEEEIVLKGRKNNKGQPVFCIEK